MCLSKSLDCPRLSRSRTCPISISTLFTNTAVKYFHPDDCPMLQEICFTIQDKKFQASFGIQNKEKENQRNEAFTKVIDQGPIARNSYRSLAALQPELPRETTIYKTKKR